MNCCICNKDINILNSKKIENNDHICMECYNHLPIIIKENISNLMAYEISSYIDYDKVYHDLLIKTFTKTASFGEVILDEHNGLIAFCKNMKSDKLPDTCHDIYKVLDIEDFDLAMKNPSIYHGGVIADIEMSIKFHTPDIKICKIVKHHEKCEATRTSTGYDYNIPPILSLFVGIVNNAREIAYKRECINLNDFFDLKDKKDYELAKATLMLDDYYDMDDLKLQRNKLLKIYHPDENIDETICLKYSQKINEAYKILRKKLER